MLIKDLTIFVFPRCSKILWYCIFLAQGVYITVQAFMEYIDKPCNGKNLVF